MIQHLFRRLMGGPDMQPLYQGPGMYEYTFILQVSANEPVEVGVIERNMENALDVAGVSIMREGKAVGEIHSIKVTGRRILYPYANLIHGGERGV